MGARSRKLQFRRERRPQPLSRSSSWKPETTERRRMEPMVAPRERQQDRIAIPAPSRLKPTARALAASRCCFSSISCAFFASPVSSASLPFCVQIKWDTVPPFSTPISLKTNDRCTKQVGHSRRRKRTEISSKLTALNAAPILAEQSGDHDHGNTGNFERRAHPIGKSNRCSTRHTFPQCRISHSFRACGTGD